MHDLAIRNGRIVDGSGAPSALPTRPWMAGASQPVFGNCGVGFAPARPI